MAEISPDTVNKASDGAQGAATQNAEGKTEQLTDEIRQQIDKDPDKFYDLSPELQNKLHSELMAEDADDGVVTPGKQEPAPKSDSDKDQDSTSEDTPDGDADKGEGSESDKIADTLPKTDWKARYKEEADNQNKWKQKFDKAKSRSDKYQKDWKDLGEKEVKVDEDFDLLDEDGQKDLQTRLAKAEAGLDFLSKKFSERDNEEATDAETNIAKSKEEGVFSQIHSLQDDFTLVKTQVPFRDLNNQWAGFLDKLVTTSGMKSEETLKDKPQSELRELAIDAFYDDPSFKESMETKGVKIPKALEEKGEMEKFELLLNIGSQANEQGGSIRANFLEYLDENGLLAKSMANTAKSAAMNAATKTVAAMEDNSPVTITPSDGPGKDEYLSGEQMTETQMKQKLDTLTKKLENGRLSDAQAQELDDLINIVSGG